MSKKLLNNFVITFFSAKKEYRSLSNFWENDVTIMDGDKVRIYESGEHCFHGEKYISQTIDTLIVGNKTECEPSKKTVAQQKGIPAPQEAHEAIRPAGVEFTHPSVVKDRLGLEAVRPLG
jgi:DNA topoisomerase IA